MTWGSDITLYNTAINALGAYAIARETNTPADTLESLKTVAQASLTAIVVPLSGTVTLPKKHIAL